MIFNDLLIFCKLKAIDSLLTPTEESTWKSFCRAYSERFCTPLPQVYQMDMEEVIGTILEANYADLEPFEEIEGILEDIYKLENPEYVKEQKKESEAFVEHIEKREKNRFKTIRERVEKLATKTEPQRRGSVDFSKLKEDK
jgi:hypothetical protein